ncbi:MAG: glycosyltransferase 87 family protein [Actinomycetota bacterium]
METRSLPALTLGLLAVAATLVIGVGTKAPCASGDWSYDGHPTGKQYRLLCYTDIVPLYGTEQLQGSRLPYLDTCQGICDEYPVLTMYAMRAAAWAPGGSFGFFVANVGMLAAAAVATTWALARLAGRRALYFALAPTLAIYSFMNWDLLAVALATLGTLAYLRRRDIWAGALLGLGAATKLYPAVLLIPFVAGRFREKEPDRGIFLAWAAAGAWLAVNLPFVLGGFRSWAEFFRFNATRGTDWDSLWFIGCHRLLGHENGCPVNWTRTINVASLLLFAGTALLVWRIRARRDPGFPTWTLGFPLIALFLLTNKVYSPQYGLWLLPWFALVLPNWKLFVLFEAADVAVFVTRFSWFGELSGVGGLPIGAFEAAVLVRAAVLVACLVAWLRSRGDPLEGAVEPASDEPQMERAAS